MFLHKYLKLSFQYPNILLFFSGEKQITGGICYHAKNTCEDFQMLCSVIRVVYCYLGLFLSSLNCVYLCSVSSFSLNTLPCSPVLPPPLPCLWSSLSSLFSLSPPLSLPLPSPLLLFPHIPVCLLLSCLHSLLRYVPFVLAGVYIHWEKSQPYFECNKWHPSVRSQVQELESPPVSRLSELLRLIIY